MARDRSTDQQEEDVNGRSDSGRGDRKDGSHGSRNGAIPGPDAVRMAKEQLAELTGHRVDSVSGLSRSEDGWDVTVELVELERIPPTTNVLGSYEVQLDEEGTLLGYDRIRRYHPGRTDDE